MAASRQETKVTHLLTRLVHAGMVATVLLAGTVSEGLMAETKQPAGMRYGKAVGQFHDVHHYAAIYQLSAPRRTGARHLELAVGALDSGGDTSAFLSLGPVWRFHPGTHSLYLEFGFSPTLISDPSLGGVQLGGNVHFTSSATVGTRFGSRDEYGVELRIQHTSNGGLDSTNPGLDAIALNFTAQIWSM